jgi:hypothetical protein
MTNEQPHVNDVNKCIFKKKTIWNLLWVSFILIPKILANEIESHNFENEMILRVSITKFEGKIILIRIFLYMVFNVYTYT